jgi:hypothetical protein
VQAKAIEAAWAEYKRAEEFAASIATSNEFAEVDAAWKSFLVHAGRVFTKLEQGSKTDGKSQAWWGRKLHERRTDALLCYLWHARNADEHTLQEIAALREATIKQVQPTQAELNEFHNAMSKQPLPYSPLALIEVTPRHFKMLDVVDRGVKYVAPLEHRGKPLTDTSAAAVTRLALSYIGEMLTQADKL